MLNPMDLTGKRIVITGASSGIGKACAIMGSRLGANVVLIGRNSERLEATLSSMAPGNHEYLSLDLSRLDSIDTIGETIGAGSAKISGIVHSAGIGWMTPLRSLEMEKLEEFLRINFYAYVELVRALTKRKYFDSNGGSIVGISSIASNTGYLGGVAYCSSKGAVDSATRVMALELAPKKIRVNTVCPSYIRTPLTLEVGKELNGIASESIEEFVARMQPLGWGEPDDVASAVLFLLSDAAKFITGSQLLVDGGYLAQ